MRHHPALVLAVFGLPAPLVAQHIREEGAFRGLPDVRIVYYDVAGTDAAAIRASLRAAQPKRPDGRGAPGMTEYDTRYAFEQKESGSSCIVTEATVTTYSTVHLPRLIEEGRVPEHVAMPWRSFLKGLAVHEAGHVRIQNVERRSIEAALIGTRCDAVKSVLRVATARIEARQKAYDAQTRNGVTQGAVLR